MLFMVTEHFKERNAFPVYRRYLESGRKLPEGLTYVNSWIEANLDRCLQLMECDDPVRIQEWIARWRDLVEFEIVPVVPSNETKKLFAPS
jgi:Protein of unknown function (DUF3303)